MHHSVSFHVHPSIFCCHWLLEPVLILVIKIHYVTGMHLGLWRQQCVVLGLVECHKFFFVTGGGMCLLGNCAEPIYSN